MVFSALSKFQMHPGHIHISLDFITNLPLEELAYNNSPNAQSDMTPFFA
jgi:hypothetical protein